MTYEYRKDTLTGKWIIENASGKVVATFGHDMETFAKSVVSALNKGLIK